MTNQIKQSNQIAQKDTKRLFYCYSPQLRKYLDLNGTHWVGKGINHTTKKPYWTFEQTTRLGKLLVSYKEECSLRHS